MIQLPLFPDIAQLIAAMAQTRQGECAWSPTPYRTWLAMHWRPSDYGLEASPEFIRAYTAAGVACGNLPSFLLEKTA